MYESKFSKYVTKSHSRFAERKEIIEKLWPASRLSPHAGAPLYYEGKSLYVDDSDNHTITIGPTGCKKSRIGVIPTAESVIAAGESAVINDPKGEIYKNTSGMARKRGADVYVLNFRKPSQSHGWNPLSQAFRFYKNGNIDAAYQCINDFAMNIIAPILEKTVERYWGDTSYTALNSFTYLLMDSVPADYFNIINLNQLCFEKNSDTLKDMLNKMDQNTPAAYGMHTVLDLVAEKTKSCVYSTLLSAMAPFSQNENLQKLLSRNDIDIEKMAEKQTVIYIIYPDEKESLSFLVNSFLTQCYETLITVSYEKEDNRLPVRVNIILDEFSNLPAIKNFENRISEARSHNIRYFLYIQSFGQLQNKYKEHAETILSNCGNWVCFSSKEIGFLKKISEICGTEVDYNGIEHDLISPAEMQHLKKYDDGAEVVVIRAGEYPYVVKLPDFAYIDNFDRFPSEKLRRIRTNHEAKVMTFSEWIEGINSGKFKFPFESGSCKKNSKSSAEDDDWRKKINSLFEE